MPPSSPAEELGITYPEKSHPGFFRRAAVDMIDAMAVFGFCAMSYSILKNAQATGTGRIVRRTYNLLGFRLSAEEVQVNVH